MFRQLMYDLKITGKDLIGASMHTSCDGVKPNILHFAQDLEEE